MTILLLGIGCSVLVQRPDEDAFVAYVTHTSDSSATFSEPDPHEWEYDWAAEHVDLVLAEGRAACDWLGDQTDAPRVDESGASTVDAMARRYLRTTRPRDIGHLSGLGKQTVVVGAWAYLCRSTRADKTSPTGSEDD